MVGDYGPLELKRAELSGIRNCSSLDVRRWGLAGVHLEKILRGGGGATVECC